MENKELIERALEFTKKEFAKSDISLSEVASNAGFSADYFNRIFAMHTGFTVMAYVNYLRLKKAAELIRKTDKTILDIAMEVGYDSHEGFSRAFKREYG